MKSYWKQGAFAAIAVVLALIIASPAMAINSTGRSEEMIFQSTCDKAGTFELKFTKNDVEIIASYLANTGNTPRLDTTYTGPRADKGSLPFIELRLSLAALNINNPVSNLRLCRDIMGDGSGFIGADGSFVNINAVPLIVLDQEVSDTTDAFLRTNPGGLPTGFDCNDLYSDIKAYVFGRAGDTFFTIYITDIENNLDWTDQNQWPWIKVGLGSDDLSSPDPNCDLGYDRDHTICVDVSGYNDDDAGATLNLNVDIDPEELTYTTSDSQIGHFKPAEVNLFDCEKNGVQCFNQNTEIIELCPIDFEQQDQCDLFYQCIIVSGDFPTDEKLKFIVRSLPEGVYLYDVDLFDADGMISSYVPTGTQSQDRFGTFFSSTGLFSDRVTNLNCTFLADYYQTVVEEDDIDGGFVRICITYQVNTNEELGTVPAEGDYVEFDIAVEKVGPCPSSLLDADIEPFQGAQFVPCGQLDTCMYFPYLIADLKPWVAGVAITNLSDLVAVEDMEITVQLTDKDGAMFTGMLPESMVTGKVITFSIDTLATEMGWDLTAEPGYYWLWVTGNFPMDGYSFLTDGTFGAGTLPRLLDACGANEYKVVE